MSFLFGAGASLLSAASQQLVSYFEYEVEQAEVEERQQQQQQQQQHIQLQYQQPAAHLSPPRRISLPSHRLLSSPTSPPPASPPSTLLSSPTRSLPTISTLSTLSTNSPPSLATCPSCTCTTAHTSPTDYALTPFTLEFATALSDHPTTFHSFPPCCPHSTHFHLTATQLVHARRLLSECGVFGGLRAEVCGGGGVRELEFWRVYFLLLHNVKTRERRQRSKQRRSRGGGRRSTRGEEVIHEDKENVSPAVATKEEKLPPEKDEPRSKQRAEQSCEEKKEDEDDGQRRQEHDRAIWAEVDRFILTLASVSSQSSSTPHELTITKVAHLVPPCCPSADTLNDSACSEHYASPSLLRPSGQLFHRLMEDEQQSVADMLAQQPLYSVDSDEQREVSRLVFSPTPSLDSSVSGDEWDCHIGDVCDNVSELDLSACSVTSISDSLRDSAHDLLSLHGASDARSVAANDSTFD